MLVIETAKRIRHLYALLALGFIVLSHAAYAATPSCTGSQTYYYPNGLQTTSTMPASSTLCPTAQQPAVTNPVAISYNVSTTQTNSSYNPKSPVCRYFSATQANCAAVNWVDNADTCCPNYYGTTTEYGGYSYTCCQTQSQANEQANNATVNAKLPAPGTTTNMVYQVPAAAIKGTIPGSQIGGAITNATVPGSAINSPITNGAVTIAGSALNSPITNPAATIPTTNVTGVLMTSNGNQGTVNNCINPTLTQTWSWSSSTTWSYSNPGSVGTLLPTHWSWIKNGGSICPGRYNVAASCQYFSTSNQCTGGSCGWGVWLTNQAGNAYFGKAENDSSTNGAYQGNNQATGNPGFWQANFPLGINSTWDSNSQPFMDLYKMNMQLEGGSTSGGTCTITLTMVNSYPS